MSDQFINLNGELIKEKLCGLSIHNRAFKYGDSLFETIRVINGRSVFLEDHFSRLKRGMKELKYDVPPYWDLAYFKKEIVKLLTQNKIEKGGRIRFTVFRVGEGYYVPKSNEFNFTIEAYDREVNTFELNNSGIKLGLFDEVSISPNRFTPFKTNNCLPYIAAGMWARSKNYDDVLLLNDKGNIVEGISSNVFIYIDGMLYTPSIKEGPIAGVMRKKIIQLTKKSGIAVIETSISDSVLKNADEVFLTNAISGVQWVSAFKKKRYFHKLAEKLIDDLNRITT